MIPVTDCKDGFLYILNSRNLNCGVYRKSLNNPYGNYTRGFEGLRKKFTMEFLDIEFHWDDGEPYGTAKPNKCLFYVPYEEGSDRLFTFLKRIDEMESIVDLILEGGKK